MISVFFSRHSVDVAKDLVGRFLLIEGKPFQIVETEAYRGTGEDLGAHSARGKTPRCAPMFEAPGHAYIYFVYGMYHMLNVTTEPEGVPGAVLIRALQGEKPLRGPGVLTRELGIDRSWNRKPLDSRQFGVLAEKTPQLLGVSPRVGLSAAQRGKSADRDLWWRFFLWDHPARTRAQENRLAQRLEADI